MTKVTEHASLALAKLAKYSSLMGLIYPCVYLKNIIFSQKILQAHLSKIVLNYFYFQGNFWENFILTVIAAAKSLQSCPTLCDPIDGSPTGSTVPGILQARTLEWVAISFSNAWKWKVKVKSLSCVRLLATPWTAAHQAPPSMGFSRQECWSGVPSPSTLTVITPVFFKDPIPWEWYGFWN